MQALRNGVPMLASSGYVSTVNETACVGCGNCKESCQFDAIAIVDQFAKVDPDVCMGCGLCEFCCPQKAIVLQRDPGRSAPLELMALY